MARHQTDFELGVGVHGLVGGGEDHVFDQGDGDQEAIERDLVLGIWSLFVSCILGFELLLGSCQDLLRTMNLEAVFGVSDLVFDEVLNRHLEIVVSRIQMADG